MNKRERLLTKLNNLKSQGKLSVTLDIDQIIAALTEPTDQNISSRPIPQNWEADGGIWQGPDD